MHAQLSFLNGPLRGQQVAVKIAQRFVLGRGLDVSLQIPDPGVSRQHAIVELETSGWVFVTDLGSSNGTFIGGKQIPPNVRTRVPVGESVCLGQNEINLDLQGVDPASTQEAHRTARLDAPLLPAEEFELIGQIGRGATGRVYAVRQKMFDRTVAAKVLRQQPALGDEDRQRFVREGQLASRIRSPHVVEVFDIRLSYGRVVLIMELVDGPSLLDRLQSGPIEVPEVLRIGEQVALGLAAAHEAGVIHRDVKPANILLSPQGVAKVSDFGIAKDLKQSAESLTRLGEGLGTLAYVSPEQALEAKKVDTRTDIYGLGATLYHALAGAPPFTPTSARVLIEIMHSPAPPLRTKRPGVPAPVAELIERMLSKEPEDRPASAMEVAHELAALRNALYSSAGIPESAQTSEDTIDDSDTDPFR
ncbi:MAG: FHA domain-containing serine/threonine-protein kinase [Planctomycetota bacterium]